MANPKIKEWFFDNFENIVDELSTINDFKLELYDVNDVEFHEEINHQACDEFVRSVAISCSSQLGLAYDEVYDNLEDNLEELFNLLETP